MTTLRRSRLLPRLLWAGAWLAAGVSTRVAGSLAALLWSVPWQHRRRRRRGRSAAPTGGPPPGDAPTTEPVAVTVDGVPLHGFVAGEGPTVLLVHGWADRAASFAGFVAPIVARGHRVVAVDLPAHGASPGHRTDGYQLARAVAGLARRFDAEVVVAHSLGGLATMLALRDGMALRGVALLAPASRLDRAFDRFVERLRLPRRAARGLHATMSRRYGPRVWEDLRMQVHAARLEVPALLVHDRSDREVAFDDTRDLADAWPGARLVETSGLGHRRLLSDERVISEVAGFVTAVHATTAGAAGTDDPATAGSAGSGDARGPARWADPGASSVAVRARA